MVLKYAGIRAFYGVLRPFQKLTRARRARIFRDSPRIRPGTRIIDPGGLPKFRREFSETTGIVVHVTLVNVPDAFSGMDSEGFRIIEGDACCLPGLEDNSLDIVFTNSVIEHVGDAKRRLDFATEVRRLAPRYWVQTPSVWFPIEPHCGMLFWWFYPESWRAYFISKWKKKLPAWAEMVEGSTIVLRNELKGIFPDGEILIERILGVPKSYMVVRNRES